jgi:hypothetical protein
MKDNLVNNIQDFLESKGIDPLYVVTILAIVILISYKNQIQNWEKQEDWVKHLIIATAFGTVILVLFNLLRLIGFVNE